jgi:hypothetical protein
LRSSTVALPFAVTVSVVARASRDPLPEELLQAKPVYVEMGSFVPTKEPADAVPVPVDVALPPRLTPASYTKKPEVGPLIVNVRSPLTHRATRQSKRAGNISSCNIVESGAQRLRRSSHHPTDLGRDQFKIMVHE